MARAKRGVKGRRRHKKWIKRASGAFGRRKNIYKAAVEVAMRGLKYSFKGRKLEKRIYRALWIQRINAASRLHGMPYGRLMAGLKRKNVALDRKILADLAVHDAAAFGKLVELAKA